MKKILDAADMIMRMYGDVQDLSIGEFEKVIEGRGGL